MSDDPTKDPRKVRDVQREYANDKVRVRWEPAYCIHTARCLTALPQVFDALSRPWVEIDAADADEIAETVMLCPTGALHFERLDGGEQEAAWEPTMVEARPNGPLFVRGRIIVRKEDGELREETRAALCRCGGSSNKPFCDGAHRSNGFRAEGTTKL